MTRNQLIDILTSINTNFSFCMTLLLVCDTAEYETIISKYTNDKNIKNLIENLKNYKKDIKTVYFQTTLLNALRQSAENIKEYCEQDKLTEDENKRLNLNKYHSHDTFIFSRLIRNCLAHNMTFNFDKEHPDTIAKLKYDSVKWYNFNDDLKEITYANNNTKFKPSFMSIHDVVNLINSLKIMAETELIDIS